MSQDRTPNPERADSPLNYESIGPYKVLGVLGQGGMGTVYKASHAKTGDLVAVKVIAAAMAQHQRFRRRFDAEIQTLVKLKHPGIVQLIGFGEEKGLLFYSMEYVDGDNLQQLLKKTGRLPWEQVVDIGIQVCSALKHAHDFGIIHRDLKPANLMVQKDGRVKLTDFGIAKLFGAADATVEGSILGTADFMSPEQAEGKPVTVRSDLYALGSVCYAALAGRAPFQGKSVPEVLFNVRYGNYPALETLVPETPRELTLLIEELLDKDPSRRPPTGLVVGNRLQSLKIGLKTHPGIAKPKTAADVGKMKELTSIDIDDNLSIYESLADNGDQTVVRQPAPSPAAPAAATSHPMVAGPHDNTVAQPTIGSDSIPSGVDLIGNTTFTEVNEVDRIRSSVTFHTEEEKSSAGHSIAIGTLVVLLVGCVGLLIYMLQGPSANSLHAQLQPAIESTQDDDWLAAEPIAVRFKERFPEDSRVADADLVIQEAELVRSVRQLQRKERRGSAEELDAVEQAYLECLKAINVSVESATSKLEAFLVMFAVEPSLTDRQKQYVLQAKRTLDDIQASKRVEHPEAYRSLSEKMDWADSNLTSAAKEKWLRAMIELFESKPWAKDLVERARAQLREDPQPSRAAEDQVGDADKL